MRSINLLKIAAEAEVLRYRCMAARQGRRAAFGAVALVFVLAVLVLGEVAAWLALCLRFTAIETTLILLGINLIIAIPFGLLAVRSSPSRAEQEALQVRQQSPDAAWGTFVCCSRARREHASPAMAQQPPIARSQIMVARKFAASFQLRVQLTAK